MRTPKVQVQQEIVAARLAILVPCQLIIFSGDTDHQKPVDGGMLLRAAQLRIVVTETARRSPQELNLQPKSARVLTLEAHSALLEEPTLVLPVDSEDRVVGQIVVYLRSDVPHLSNARPGRWGLLLIIADGQHLGPLLLVRSYMQGVRHSSSHGA